MNSPPGELRLDPRRNVTGWVVCAIAFVTYIPSLFSQFIRDDHFQIVNNPQVQSWDYLPRLFSTHLWSHLGTEYAVHFYRPLFSAWMLVVNTIGGLSPTWWHFSSIFLHAVTTLAVYKLCDNLLQNRVAALFAALLFAVHPIHVDAVSWVSASNEILFTLLALGAIIVLLTPDESIPLTPFRLAASAALYAAALLTKETAVALLPVPLLIVCLRDRQRKKVVEASYWYISVTIAYFAIRWWALQRIGIEESRHSWQQVLLSSSSVVVFYLKKLLLPIRLSGFYVNPIISSPTISVWLAAGGLLLAAALLTWFALRYSPLVGVGASIIIFPLLPALLALRIYDQGDMTHDRYLYLPSVGVCLLFGLLVRWLWPGPKLVRLILVTASTALLFGFGYLTIQQQKFYKNDELFFQRAIDLDPTNVYVIDCLGAIYLENGEADRAMKEFRIAWELAPSDPRATYDLAHGLFETHQYVEAEPMLRLVSRSPELESKRKAILLALADTKISLGNLSGADEVLQELNQLDPKFPALHRTLGIVFQREGRLTEAQLEYHREFQVSGDMQAEQQAIAMERLLSSPPRFAKTDQ
jgi:Flp pilus assembly protein TadD